MPEYIESVFTSSEGTKLFCRTLGAKKQRAVIVLVHGFAEHAGRYLHLAKFLQENNFSCFMLDLRGHGLSDGKRGFILSIEEYLSDIQMAVLQAKKTFQVDKVFMFAHSMGGLLASLFTFQNQDLLHGLILSSPSFALKIAIPKWKYFLGKTMSSFSPGFSLAHTIKPEFLSKDQKILDDYKKDSLILEYITARLFTEVLSSYEVAFERAEEISLPLFMQLSDNDVIVCPKKSEIFFYKTNSFDRTIKNYSGFFHEIYNEVNRELPMIDLLDWLNKRS